MLTTLTSRQPTKIDRFAVVRAAKAAIQGGQQQQASHPLPPLPSQAQLPRPTPGMSVDLHAAPMISVNDDSNTMLVESFVVH